MEGGRGWWRAARWEDGIFRNLILENKNKNCFTTTSLVSGGSAVVTGGAANSYGRSIAGGRSIVGVRMEARMGGVARFDPIRLVPCTTCERIHLQET